jgi:hypothetical protein
VQATAIFIIIVAKFGSICFLPTLKGAIDALGEIDKYIVKVPCMFKKYQTSLHL